MATETDEVFFDHQTTQRLGNDVAAFFGVPCAAGGTGVEGAHDMGLDVGGDAGFGGHSDSPCYTLTLRERRKPVNRLASPDAAAQRITAPIIQLYYGESI